MNHQVTELLPQCCFDWSIVIKIHITNYTGTSWGQLLSREQYSFPNCEGGWISRLDSAQCLRHCLIDMGGRVSWCNGVPQPSFKTTLSPTAFPQLKFVCVEYLTAHSYLNLYFVFIFFLILFFFLKITPCVEKIYSMQFSIITAAHMLFTINSSQLQSTFLSTPHTLISTNMYLQIKKTGNYFYH